MVQVKQYKDGRLWRAFHTNDAHKIAAYRALERAPTTGIKTEVSR